MSIDLMIRDEKAEQALKEQEKMWKATKEDLLRWLEVQKKEKAEKKEDHDA